MSTIPATTSDLAPTIAPKLTVKSADRAVIAALVAAAALAVFLRGWDIAIPYASGDQAVLGYAVRHSYGVRWLLDRNYGPVTETLNRAFAALLSAAGIPMSEATDRLPAMLVGLAQVAVTYPLLRRMRCFPIEAAAGTAVAAALPVLVTDSRLTWAWGYLSIWLLAGTIALWATLAYLDDRRPWQLALAGASLLTHCLSNVYSFALPATLILLWAGALRNKNVGQVVRRPPADGSPAAFLQPHDTRGRSTLRLRLCNDLPYEEKAGHAFSVRERILAPAVGFRHAAIGLVGPCTAALAVIAACWWWTGHGQIGHLLVKQQRGTAGLQLDQIARLPAMWATHFGYLFGLAAAAALMTYSFAGGSRKQLLAIWAWLGLLPVWLLADWDRIGYPEAYFIETAYAAGLLGAILIVDACRRLPARALPRYVLAALGVLAFAQMAIGTADDCLGQGHLATLTGIANKPAELRHDIGAKAAGWYVRTCVPADAIILCLHDNKGMEASVAEYYLGRRVLAGYDQPADTLPALLAAMCDDVDVVIVDADREPLLAAAPRFTRVCTIRDRGRPIRYVYARPAMSLPQVDEDVRGLDQAYDCCYRPTRVPIPLPAAAGFERCLSKYQNVCKTLKHGHN